ncbi:MAG: hypothetical protein Q4P05_02685 [Actinomycetaceae bacterium]|nr:hypothetical protein [Actinomycetaceae bacterium]
MRERSVTDRIRAIDQAIIDLRFAEGLRRNWEAVRAETNIQLAYVEAASDGARTSLEHLRLASIGRAGATDPAEALALDYWRAHLWISQQWPPLNTRQPVRIPHRPLPVVVASAHKFVCARLVGETLTENAIAIPSDSASVRVFIRILSSSLPVPTRSALAIAWAYAHPFFSVASQEVARVVVRHVMVTTGFEPTGTLVWMHPFVEHQAEVKHVLQEVDWAEPQTVGRWVKTWITLMGKAVDPTLEMIRHVQAGTVPKT